MIQADGVINPEETDLLAKVLGHLDLEPEDIAQAGTWLMKPQSTDLNALKSAFPEAGERQVVSALFLELAQADSMLGHPEIRLLSDLAKALGQA